MWKELTVEETDEELERLAETTNQFSCWRLPKSDLTDSKEMLRLLLIQKKYPYRCFVYKDDKYEIIKDFRYRADKGMWELIRGTVKWDTTDPTIDPLEGIRISIIHTKSFLQEVGGKKIFKLSDFQFNEVDETISKWYNNKLIELYEELGFKVTCLDNGNYWEWELI